MWISSAHAHYKLQIGYIIIIIIIITTQVTKLSPKLPTTLFFF